MRAVRDKRPLRRHSWRKIISKRCNKLREGMLITLDLIESFHADNMKDSIQTTTKTHLISFDLLPLME